MDYFNFKERAKQVAFSAVRDRWFSSIIDLLAKHNVRPNVLTYSGVLFLIGACICPPKYYFISTLLLSLYLVMDGIDGGLARKQKLNHSGGSIIDIWADQMGVILIPAAATYHLGSSPIPAILFSNGYIIFIVLVVVINQLKLRAKWIVRVKFPMYFLYLVCLVFSMDLMTYFFAFFSIYYWIGIVFLLQVIYGYYGSNTKA